MKLVRSIVPAISYESTNILDTQLVGIILCTSGKVPSIKRVWIIVLSNTNCAFLESA